MCFRKILITGGCGFLGQYVIQTLLSTIPNISIKVVDIKDRYLKLFDYGCNDVEFIIGKNISDYNSIRQEFVGVDAVIHLAGLVSFSYVDRDLLREVNVLGTRSVLRASEEAKVSKFLHISSVAAFGYTNDPNVLAEENFLFDWEIAKRKKKYYMLSKYEADQEVLATCKRGFNATIVAPGLMLGPGDFANSVKLIRAIAEKKIPFNPPGGTNIVDVRDVACGIVQLLQQPKGRPVYFLSGENLTLEEVHRVIAGHLKTDPPRFKLPRCLRDPLFLFTLFLEKTRREKISLSADNIDSAFCFRYFSNKRAFEDIRWAPKISFSETIHQTIEWMKTHGLFTK